jgi:glycosyltransferase involved in cell wall biosynthesis
VPLSIERSRSAEMQALVKSEIADIQPHVVFADGWLTGQFVPDDFAGLKLLHEHNAEHELWERQAELEGGLRRWLVRREAGRVRRYEGELVKRFDTTLAVSPDDRRALGRIGGDLNRIKVLPNIPDSSLLERPAPSFAATEPAVLFFGTLSWQPNIEGLERYLSFGHKQVIKRMPDSRLIVAGKGASADLVRRMEQAPNVEFLGEVEDSEELYTRARVAVDSSRSGGGTRLKILNALARGVPVVASTEAAKGLDIVLGEHMIVAKNEHGLIDGITSLLQDEARWRVLSENGRALIRGKYVPETAFVALDEALARAPRRR